MICPRCHGGKEIFAFTLRKDGKAFNMTCDFCDGEGHISDIHEDWIREGKAMKFWRRQEKMTLRQESRRRGMEPSTLSAMERGKIEPIWPTIIK